MLARENKKTYFLWVLGCQMNKSDGERLEHVLELMGFSPAASENEANLIGVVSCSVRQKAIDRIHGKIAQWNAIKRDRPLLTLLTGCVLPYDRAHVVKKFDIFVEMKDIIKLPSLISQFSGFEMEGKEEVSVQEEYSDYFHVKPKYHESFRAFVPLMSGCNKFCTFCAVPYTRGRERSRGVNDVLSEIQHLAKTGCKEIVLLGQNVNSYHPRDVEQFSKSNPYHNPFAALLFEIHDIAGIERVHFTAPHPKDMTDEAIDVLTLPKHVNYLHLPLQSGDDAILSRMNRKYTADGYCSLVERIRKRVPMIALGTDIIVGFCGETEAQFNHTVEIYKELRFDISYTAMYSQRPGTVAARVFQDDVQKEEKKRRWQKLQAIMEEITLRKNMAFKDQIVSVLVDRFEDGYCFGNSREYKLVRFASLEDLTGQIVSVHIHTPFTWMLEGELVSEGIPYPLLHREKVSARSYRHHTMKSR